MSKLSNSQPFALRPQRPASARAYGYILPLRGNYLPSEAYIAWKVGYKGSAFSENRKHSV